MGVVLWEMVTGHVVFRGSPSELMYLHQHAPLPLQQLKAIPQNIKIIIKRLLEKDPGQRFQTPNELLGEVASIARAIEVRRNIKHEKSLGTLIQQPTAPRTKLPVIRVPERSIAVLPFDSLSEDKGNTFLLTVFRTRFFLTSPNYPN